MKCKIKWNISENANFNAIIIFGNIYRRTHIFACSHTVDILKRRYAHRDVRIRSKKPPGGEKGNRRAPKILWPTAKHPTETLRPETLRLNYIHSIQRLTYLSLIFFSCLYVRFALIFASFRLAWAHPQIPFSSSISTPFTTAR